ncbi:MAG: regulatory protein RecX, partial [Blautia sp.]|nr:regulatory protein RecX [Blautia sp.]
MPLTPEEQKKARRKALLLLEHMDRTEKGLSDRLRQAGFSIEAVEDALAYVRSYGYLDDDRY